MSNDFWQELFLSFKTEEKRLVTLSPILLKCSKEDIQIVGSLIWSHFVNNDEWNGTFRFTAKVIANVFNKRFSSHEWSYIDFYLSNLNWKNLKDRYKDWRRMEKKYDSKICSNCKVDELEEQWRKFSEDLEEAIRKAKDRSRA